VIPPPLWIVRAKAGSLTRSRKPVRIDRRWDSGQAREGGAGHPRRSVATRARLIGALAVVMRQEGFGRLPDLLASPRQMHPQALLTKRAVKSLDVRVQIGTMRGDDIGFHPKAQPEAHQRGREVAATGTAHKARIIIKGEHGRQVYGLRTS
jgi:hypothetical protein